MFGECVSYGPNLGILSSPLGKMRCELENECQITHTCIINDIYRYACIQQLTYFSLVNILNLNNENYLTYIKDMSWGVNLWWCQCKGVNWLKMVLKFRHCNQTDKLLYWFYVPLGSPSKWQTTFHHHFSNISCLNWPISHIYGKQSWYYLVRGGRIVVDKFGNYHLSWED